MVGNKCAYVRIYIPQSTLSKTSGVFLFQYTFMINTQISPQEENLVYMVRI
jgi:hypothetical protein